MKKKLKILAIVLGVTVTLLLLFVTAFIYNPTEGSLADMRDVVPRNIHFFMRKTALAEDFDEFPTPKFWAEFADSTTWRDLQRMPMVKELQKKGGVASAIEEIRGVTQEIAANSGGWLSLKDDVLGTEVIVAGRFQGRDFESSKYCAYFRGSWKVRFLWGLLGWGWVRDEVAASGPTLELLDDGTMTLESNGQTFHIARHLDCVMLSNDEELLQKSITLARGDDASEDTFGSNEQYRDGIEARLRSWSELNDGMRIDALELFAQPDELFKITSWDDGWPNKRHPDDMNERVLASFLNLSGWRFLSGSVVFEESSLTALARVELNRNKHTGFQAEFFRAESAPYEDWLLPFLAMVPEGVGGVSNRGACAAAALRMNAADFLVEMYEALDDQSLIDDPLRKTGKYTGARALIDELRTVLLPRTGFVFMRKQDLGDEVEIFDPTPAPHWAWVFWLRPNSRGVLQELRKYLSDNATNLGFTKVTDLRLPGLSDPCREFMNPHIPGTGEVALLLYGDFFILANSSFVARDMISARLDSKSLLQDDNWDIFERELPSRINGFVYANGERLGNVFSDYVQSIADESRTPDPAWEMQNRSRFDRKVFQAKYRQYGSIAQIPESLKPQFDADVAKEMDLAWIDERAAFTKSDRDHYDQLRVMCRMLDAAYLQVELDPQFIQLTSGILLER